MRVRTVTFAVVSALALAALVSPAHHLMPRLGPHSWMSSLLVVAGLLCVLFVSVVLVVSRALSQVTDLQNAVANRVHDLAQALLDSPLPLSRARVNSAEEQLAVFVQHSLPRPAAGATMFVDAQVGVLLAVLLLLFFLRDGVRIGQWVLRWTPVNRKYHIDDAGTCAWKVLSCTHGTVPIALVDSIGIGTGMFVLGVPLAALHSVVNVVVVTVETTVGGILGAIAAAPLVAVAYRVIEQLADRDTSVAGSVVEEGRK